MNPISIHLHTQTSDGEPLRYEFTEPVDDTPGQWTATPVIDGDTIEAFDVTLVGRFKHVTLRHATPPLTDDDLGRDGHHTVFVNDQRCRLETGHGPLPTHVAIPIDQYRRIFGEP